MNVKAAPVVIRAIGLLALIVFVSARTGKAQAHELSIRIVVVDTAKHGMSGVSLTIVRGLNQEVTTGATDSAGRALLRVPKDTGAYQVVARRIGYQRAVHFFARALVDSIAIQLEMRRTVQQLDA